jgi:hypothetical protein
LQLLWSHILSQDTALLLKLVAAQLTPAAPNTAAGSGSGSSSSSGITCQWEQQLAGWQLAALELPLLQQLVFATHKVNKQWAAAVLRYVRTEQQQQQQQQQHSVSVSSSPEGGAAGLPQQGPLAGLQVVSQLLQQWWLAPQQQQQQAAAGDGTSTVVLHRGHQLSADHSAAVSWLLSFTTAPQQQQQVSSAAAVAGSGQVSEGFATPSDSPQGFAAWCTAQGVNPAVQLLLAALLLHPEPPVVSAAGSALQQLLLRVPQLGPAFLPVVLQQLRLSYTAAAAAADDDVGGNSSKSSAAAMGRQVHQLLLLLPAMCTDASCAALVWRALHPLLAAAQQHHQQQQQLPFVKQQQQQLDAGGVCRAVSVALSVAGWQLTGRGWGRAEAAVNGCVNMSGVLPGSTTAALGREPLTLRLQRAAAVR